MASLRARVVLAVAAALAPIVVIEAGLQIAGVFARHGARKRAQAAYDPKLPLVAFAGDSNMYGAYIDHPAMTLPKQVERLALRANGKGLATLNLGVPASPSWRVLEQVQRAVELKPVAVVVRCGINNQWQVPPEEGLGVLENLKIVRWARIRFFNKSVAEPSPESGGVPREGAAQFAIARPNRLGESHRLEVDRPAESVPFETAMAQLDRDVRAMHRLAQGVGAKLVLATYSAGFETAFSHTRRTMKSLASELSLEIADCAATAQQAIEGGGTQPAPTSYEERIARRASILTRDRHPTGRGYSIEAIVVSDALSRAGILDGWKPKDPLEPMRTDPPKAPALERIPGEPSQFRLRTLKGDRAVLALGTPGESIVKEMSVPLNWKALRESTGSSPLISANEKPDKDGFIHFTIPEAMLKALPPGARAIAVVERGGEFGAACVLCSNLVELR